MLLDAENLRVSDTTTPWLTATVRRGGPEGGEDRAPVVGGDRARRLRCLACMCQPLSVKLIVTWLEQIVVALVQIL
jgi:hypothetical protein